MGNGLLLMQLNSQCEFYNFYATALDVTGPLGLILRYRNGYKRGECDEVRYLTGYPSFYGRESH